MVCEKCEKKLGTVITPDTWEDGARNTTESGGRKLNENKALTHTHKARFDPHGKNKFFTCRIFKSSVHQPGSNYFQSCAYKKGICAMRGEKVWDTKNYKQMFVYMY
ncbi:cysteine-rich PDZ-binding protein-like [Myotis daubentonii]|uniref:cysteine-rich PDZ-binding protein-like n=1 Tax=Myotis daubentonii TaxID=98922 RepID=UPI002872FBD7|nr:cysteine-rich PDZ-binding protein-like [Myotis daubentonii]